MQVEITQGLLFLGGESGPLFTDCFAVRVLDIDEPNNKLRVRIHGLLRPDSQSWEEDWNLAHTRAGFKNGFYVPARQPGRTGAVIDYVDDVSPELKKRQDARLKAFQAAGSMTGRFSSSKPPTSVVSNARHYMQQAEAAAKAPIPLPPGAKPLGDGAMADSYVLEVDYAAIEQRIASKLDGMRDACDLQVAELLARVEKLIDLLPIPTDERMAEHPLWMQQAVPITARIIELKQLIRDRLNSNARLANLAVEAVAAEWYAKMEVPPGYQNYYQDGIRAHNRGEHPDQAPFHHLDQKVTLAWLRGWTAARRAEQNKDKPTGDEAQS